MTAPAGAPSGDGPEGACPSRLDEWIGETCQRPVNPGQVAHLDQVEAVLRDAAAEASVDLTDRDVARGVAFGVHAPMFVTDALGSPQGSVTAARRVASQIAHDTQEMEK